MTIRVICKNCGSKIEAKKELLGQVRNCPKCHSKILIDTESNTEQKTNITKTHVTQEIANTSVDDNSQSHPQSHAENILADVPGTEQEILYDNIERLPSYNPPAKLVPNYRYFIFSHERMIAFWEISKGWQFNIGSGFVNAQYNKELLPNNGNFKFVEMVITQTESGKQFAGLRTFSITGKWAVLAIGRESNEILSKIDGKAVLTKQQRTQLLAFIRSNYMPEFLNNCKEVYDYLICDFTSESDVFVQNFSFEK